jgi:nicotinamide phosphoribosyltransferase
MLKDIRSNPIMLTDSYNLSHQHLKVNVDWEVSHIYNRTEGMILYGFSEIVNSVLTTQITMDMVDEAEQCAKQQGVTFPRELWERVVNECNGYMPLHIQSLPEGVWCPKGTPFAQVRNTIEGFGELVTWLEGIFLMASFPCGTATEAFHMRRYLEEVKEREGFDDNFLIRLHSFGFRGHRSLEDAYWAGTSWNMFLFGTDDFHTLKHTPKAKVGSISALAHKVTQQFDDEYKGYIHTIDATAEKGEKIVAVVIDTYDANRFIDEYLVPLAKYAETKGVHLVIRPDSGDVQEQVVEVWHKVMAYGLSNVSAIIGENMSYQNVQRADFFFTMRQVPLNFVSYGVGGGFYNHINRDTLGFAMKTAYSNGKPRMKFGMNPIKRSIPDKVALVVNEDGLLEAIREKEWYEGEYTLGDNLYQNIYLYDNRHILSAIKPFHMVFDWEETQYNAHNFLAIKELQERIVLSEGINKLVEGFEEQYA